MRKRMLAIGLCAAMVMVSAAGCSSVKETKVTKAEGTASEETQAGKDLEGSLVFAIWDNNLMDYIDEIDMVGEFQEKYPSADIDVKKLKIIRNTGIQ